MAVQRLHLARVAASDRTGGDRRAICACAAAMLLLVTGVAALHEWGPASGKQEANRIVSPLDRSLAPPAFVPSEAIKVKRTARVTVIPEKKRHHRHHSIRHRRTHRHTHAASARPTDVSAPNAPASVSRPVEPPITEDP